MTGEPGGTGGAGKSLVLAVFVLIAAAVALSVLLGFRAAAYALAALLALVALARGLLPVRVVGPLAVRSRWVDVTTSAVMAVALVVLARGVPE